MLETPLHFSVSRDRAIAMIREEWPEFTEEQFDDLIDRKRIDWRFIDGELFVLDNFLDSLRVYPKEVPGMRPDPTDGIALDVYKRQVHDLADRRLRVGSDLDQVETLVVGDALGIADGEQAELRAIDANQTARRCSDLVVDAGVIRLSYFPYLHSDVYKRQVYCRRMSTRPVSCYALFEWMAASKPTSWLSGRTHILCHSAGTWGP